METEEVDSRLDRDAEARSGAARPPRYRSVRLWRARAVRVARPRGEGNEAR